MRPTSNPSNTNTAHKLSGVTLAKSTPGTQLVNGVRIALPQVTR